MTPEPTKTPLRIFYLEDNPLIAFHMEQILEDLGHVFVGSLGSFTALKEQFGEFDMEAALVDIDLLDGRTGPDAAAWLAEQGIPCLFVTGQKDVAAEHRHAAVDTVLKPVAPADLAAKIEKLVPVPAQ